MYFSTNCGVFVTVNIETKYRPPQKQLSNCQDGKKKVILKATMLGKLGWSVS